MIAERRRFLVYAQIALFTVLGGTLLAWVADTVAQALPLMVRSFDRLDGSGVEPLGGVLGIGFTLLFLLLAIAVFAYVGLSARAAVDAAEGTSSLRRQAVIGVVATALGIVGFTFLLPIGLTVLALAGLGAKSRPARRP